MGGPEHIIAFISIPNSLIYHQKAQTHLSLFPSHGTAPYQSSGKGHRISSHLPAQMRLLCWLKSSIWLTGRKIHDAAPE